MNLYRTPSRGTVSTGTGDFYSLDPENVLSYLDLEIWLTEQIYFSFLIHVTDRKASIVSFHLSGQILQKGKKRVLSWCVTTFWIWTKSTIFISFFSSTSSTTLLPFPWVFFQCLQLLAKQQPFFHLKVKVFFLMENGNTTSFQNVNTIFCKILQNSLVSHWCLDYSTYVVLHMHYFHLNLFPISHYYTF